MNAVDSPIWVSLGNLPVAHAVLPLTIVFHYAICIFLQLPLGVWSESNTSAIYLVHGKAVIVGCSPARLVLGTDT